MGFCDWEVAHQAPTCSLSPPSQSATARPRLSTSALSWTVTINSTTAGYIPATVPLPATVKDWAVVVLNFNTSDPADGCSAYPPGTPSLAGKVPGVRRGTCTFDTKVANLEALGAKYVLAYNNDNPLPSPLLESATSMLGKPLLMPRARM